METYQEINFALEDVGDPILHQGVLNLCNIVNTKELQLLGLRPNMETLCPK